MSRAFRSRWELAPTRWDHAARVCVGIALLFAITRWWFAK